MKQYQWTLKSHYPLVRFSIPIHSFKARDGDVCAMIGKRGYANAGQCYKQDAIRRIKEWHKDWYIRLEYLGQGLYQTWLGGTK